MNYNIEKIICFLMLALSIVSIVFIIIIFAKTKNRVASTKNNEHQLSEEYNVLFSIPENNLFSFELIQDKETLLKKNSGHDLCNDDIDIEYVEYCESVRY